MTTFSAIVAFALIVAGAAYATECRDDPEVVGQCFMVHGRVQVTAGLRINLDPVGADKLRGRVLGVQYAPIPPHDGGYTFVPKSLEAALTLDNYVFGDFEVCPFTSDRPGVMRFVCIQSASRLVVRAKR